MDNTTYPEIQALDITEPIVRILLEKTNPTKAQGADEIPARILNELATQVAPVLTEIFRRSIETGVVPADWRRANITPIFKKGKKSDPGNYRPVSLTSICSKLLEHIIVKHMMKHLEQNAILKDCQHGFRSKRSCETQLVTFVQEIVDAMPGGGQTDVILMDFSKAFDRVPHQRLLQKLSYYGIRGPVHRWIQHFLVERQQRVLVDGACSEFVDVRSGVPQGSVMGPILFLLYINDLPDMTDSDVRLFADDAAVYRQIRSEDDAEELQKDLDRLLEWEDRWQMSFHPDKCKVLHITRAKKLKSTQKYKLRNCQLKEEDSAAYLGVEIDKKMTWQPHINNVTQRATRNLNFVRRNVRACSQKAKETAYNSLVRPTLDYCSIVYNPHTDKQIKQVEMVQRRAARFVTNRYHNTSSVTDMLDTLGWETLAERRAKLSVTFMYKIIHGYVAIPMVSYFIPLNTVTRGQQAYRYHHIQALTEYHRQSYFVRVIPWWNHLPSGVVEAPSLEGFKTQLAHCSVTP